MFVPVLGVEGIEGLCTGERSGSSKLRVGLGETLFGETLEEFPPLGFKSGENDSRRTSLSFDTAIFTAESKGLELILGV